MKKKILVMLLACSMLAGISACGKDTDSQSNNLQEESTIDETFQGVIAESSVSIELAEDEEGGFIS